MIASPNFAAALHSPSSTRIPCTTHNASHSTGHNLARWAALAARIATLKPFSGMPALAKREALRMSRWIRWYTSASSALRSAARSSMRAKAVEKEPWRVRASISRMESWNRISGSVGRKERRDRRRWVDVVKSDL